MEFTQGEPLTEEQAIAHVESLGYHSLAFDDSHDVDEELHWHEFDSVAIVISGSGSFADETGAVTQVQPGCMVTAWGFKSPSDTNSCSGRPEKRVSTTRCARVSPRCRLPHGPKCRP